MSAAVAHVLFGVAAGFLVWFPAGWLAKRDENRQVARQLTRRRDRGCTCTHPRPVTAVAERVDAGRRGLAAGSPGEGDER